ncbi:uroporphyrinogen-III synthase [Polynucleobacter sp. AP-Nino-20-G2]|uniref:uroporphyrinogen-III synthase n=1 Tax=Polynucleobacter sp. AP-Nino-20-G2 TaxID=2576917 RepID=UPI001BFDFA86|nr:uroporphyrinogen-III synthase [Polynucleobacter sp. AP-Nino-20-G2]QWE17119.1 uroporphyrinogen-III synthase [Polynucleobacter sp. AP-Nino-20-G2]
MSAKTIVITRPTGQARQLSEILSAHLLKHGVSKEHAPKIISLPLLTIVPKADPVLIARIETVLAHADLAIFVSPNAIECTMRLLERSWVDVSGKPVPIGVMGGSSMAALHHHGIGKEASPTQIILPQDNANWDSEGLWSELKKLDWDWSSKKVVIFKGEGGRDWLADTLKKAGADLEAISVYARVPLDIDSPAWSDIHEMDFSQSLWLLTSSEAVRYLGQVIADQFGFSKQGLAVATAICPHHNIADAAEQIGFGEVFTCEPGDDALIAASLAWLSV